MTVEIDPIQTATTDFFVPITLAYIAVCLTWLTMRRSLQKSWPHETPAETEHKWLDLLMVLVAGVGVFAIGSAYRNGLLIPKTGTQFDGLIAGINLCLPYAPIFTILILRRQSVSTVWASYESLHWKLLTGSIAAVIGVTVFIASRGELNRAPQILADSVSSHALIHAPAVFLEAVAVAFIFVRLKWVTGAVIAVLIGSLLFAAGHIPSGIDSGRSVFDIAAFFVFNTALAAFIFSIVVKSRDVIWIAIPHYFLDIAINAFE